MNKVWDEQYFNNLKFIKSNLQSPINGGIFDIYINYENNIIYKKIKNKNSTIYINIEKYRDIILNLYKIEIINKYILNPKQIYIETDGSYYSTFIKNSIRLFDININSNINNNILNKILNCIKTLQYDLTKYIEKYILSGDWAIHNLLYCIDTENLYNIDLEGFYTYPFLYNNGNCNINYFNTKITSLIELINNLINKNEQEQEQENYFTLILWNPIHSQITNVLKDIPNIIEKKSLIILKEDLYDYIFDIYKLDIRCCHNVVLPPKINN